MTPRERTITLPDGRRLQGMYQSEDVGWVLRVDGEGQRAVAARDLTDALYELLALPIASGPAWLDEVLAELAGQDTALGLRFPCPCCGFLTLSSAPSGTYEICDVCYWEDDGVQYRDPTYEGGANEVSLDQARKNYKAHGTSEIRFAKYVRPPLPEEEPGA